ncbi:AbrB family transcriptional regulator [Phytohabitans sp. ZYX-F-186]|uniref:AbrB family transcriptional regulator n=1 Tax=Phytohabitans maris TaxID=3071409 RepID=A0ABU0ZB45_9ACTN|nr:AbrB family transcriptional regulator [Phytohabitans sp. ZYX-F-186]MDQ7903639.1 AbrB family transcriptional regulator [Phytohabitans sp. ZYX-F-186]
MSAASVVRWLAVVAASGVLAYPLALLGLPGPTLFAGLVAGLAAALSGRFALEIPPRLGHTAFAVVGVAIGQTVTVDVIKAVAADGLAVAVALVTTLVLSVAAGFVLSKATAIDRPTGAFGMIAGGASGVVVVSEEAGADASLVAIMQYLRVLVVIFSIPLVTGLVAAGTAGGARAGPPVAASHVLEGLLFCAVVAGVGAGVAALVGLQSSALLGPMLLAAAVAILWPGLVRPTPVLLQDVAFLVVGLQVGLRFSLARLRLAARSLPAIMVAILAVMGGCAAIGAGMAWWTGRPFFECYLATTPGGLNAVLAAAIQGDADVAYVTSVQVLRLFVMLLAAPVLGWWLKRRLPPPRGGPRRA